MSSSLSLFACIENLDRVISCVKDSESAETEEIQQGLAEDGWDVAWNEFDDEDKEKCEGQFDEKATLKNWLQDCCVSISPYEDLIAIGRNEKLVILTAKWDRHATSEPKTKFEISWTGQLVLEEGECISSLLCLPLASQHKSSQGFPDWTCIVAGFTSGYVRFYLEDGSLLLYQLLHEDPVLKLKCQTWQPGVTHTDFEQVEELAILYPTTLVLLDGFSLYQSLRGCRNQLARAQASGTQESIKPPPLAYKKWNLKDQKNISDIASCGMVTPSIFDQLQTASFIGGCDANIRVTPPAMSQFITTGSDPFVGVYSAVEGGSPPLISEVALEVATKLTSAVLSKLSVAGGWLGWGSSKSEATKQPQDPSKTKPKVEKGTSLPLRYSLSDQRRDGVNITLSPDRRLAATTDEFGRVMLISTKQGIVLRTWKGYRDAECAWVPVEEEVHDIEKTTSSHVTRRTALFLIIHAPRRGILEVWTTEYGPRAAAFNVGRDCRLLYTGHHILGLSHVMGQSSDNSSKPVRCILVQPSGDIKVLAVPFHCALSDKFSRRVRDLHLLKKLSTILDHSKEQEDLKGRALEKLETTVLEILSSIQVPVLLQQGLQCVLSTVGLPITLLKNAVYSVSQNILKKPNVSDDHEHEDEHDIQTVLNFSKVQNQLIQMYDSLSEGKRQSQTEQDAVQPDDENQWFASLLSLTVSETTTLLTSIEQYWTTRDQRVDSDITPASFDVSITNFLSCFEMATNMATDQHETLATTSSENISIRVRKNLSSETLRKLGSCIFKDTFDGISSAEKLCLILDCAGIFPLDILDLLMCYWLAQDGGQSPDDLTCIATLHNLLSSITSIKGLESSDNVKNNTDDGVSTLSAWWERQRHLLAETTVTSHCLAAAVCCRSVMMVKQMIAKKLEDDDHHGNNDVDWVSVSMEMERWNLLVNQLDDLLTLATFCLSVGKVQEITIHCSDVLKNLSVLNILGRPRSGITEVVARLVVQHAIDPRCLGYPCSKTKQRSSEADDDIPEEVPEERDPGQLLEGLSLLRKRFPHSLEQEILWTHCSFEYVCQWLKNKELSGYLQKALGHAKCINNCQLSHGICILLWNKVKGSVSAMTMLTEKVGKAPKERLCLKTVEMSGPTLIQFLVSTREILQFLAEVSHNGYNGDENDCEEKIFEVEDFWKTGETLPCSFVDEVMAMKRSNHQLVVVHYWLVSLLWLIMGLNMKGVKLLSLTGAQEKKLLFKGMHLFYESKEVETAVREERRKFFPKALSSVVQLVGSNTSPNAQRISDEWCLTIYELAEQDNIDFDPLKVDFICELCSAGLHRLAVKAFVTVRDKAALSAKLLKIIGQRVAENVFAHQDPAVTARILSSLTTSVSSWIRKQDPAKLKKKDAPLADIHELLSLVVTSLPDETKERDIATSLTDILKTVP